MICDDTRITNIQDHLRRWVEFFEDQFSWSFVPTTLTRLSCPPWLVTTNPLGEEEVHKKLQLLSWNKSPGPNDLLSSLSKNGGELLVRNLTRLLGSGCETKSVPLPWNEAIVLIFKRAHVTNVTIVDCFQIVGSYHSSRIVHNVWKADPQGSGRFSITSMMMYWPHFHPAPMLEHHPTYCKPTIVVSWHQSYLRSVEQNCALELCWRRVYLRSLLPF